MRCTFHSLRRPLVLVQFQNGEHAYIADLLSLLLRYGIPPGISINLGQVSLEDRWNQLDSLVWSTKGKTKPLSLFHYPLVESMDMRDRILSPVRLKWRDGRGAVVFWPALSLGSKVIQLMCNWCFYLKMTVLEILRCIPTVPVHFVRCSCISKLLTMIIFSGPYFFSSLSIMFQKRGNAVLLSSPTTGWNKHQSWLSQSDDSNTAKPSFK